MATEVTDPYTIASEIVAEVIENEFDDDGSVILRHDRIHDSLGSDNKTYIGIEPVRIRPDNVISDLTLLIRFNGKYNLKINPNQYVDPRIIANKAERLRRALLSVRVVGEPLVWSFLIGDVEFPPDPTGNMSRFTMQISVVGNNSGLVETSG